MKIIKKLISSICAIAISLMLLPIHSYAYNTEWNHEFSNKDGYPVHFTFYLLCRANGNYEEGGLQEITNPNPIGSAVQYYNPERGLFEDCSYVNRVVNGKLVDTVIYNNYELDVWQYNFSGDYEEYVFPTYYQTSDTGALAEEEGVKWNPFTAYVYASVPMEYRDYEIPIMDDPVFGLGNGLKNNVVAHDALTVTALEDEPIIRFYVVNVGGWDGYDDMGMIVGGDCANEEWADYIKHYDGIIEFFHDWAIENEKYKSALSDEANYSMDNANTPVIESTESESEPESEPEPIIVPQTEEKEETVVEEPKSNRNIIYVIGGIAILAIAICFTVFINLSKKKK